MRSSQHHQQGLAVVAHGAMTEGRAARVGNADRDDSMARRADRARSLGSTMRQARRAGVRRPESVRHRCRSAPPYRRLRSPGERCRGSRAAPGPSATGADDGPQAAPEHARRKHIDTVLLKQAALLREASRRGSASSDVPASDTAGSGWAQARERVQQRRLSGPVTSKDDPAFAGSDVEAQCAKRACGLRWRHRGRRTIAVLSGFAFSVPSRADKERPARRSVP